MRIALFLLLVVVVPVGVFWAGQGFRTPDETWSTFRRQASALPGRQSGAPRKGEPNDQEQTDGDVPDQGAPKKPETPEKGAGSSGKPKRDTQPDPKDKPKVNPQPKAPPPDPLTLAHQAFSAGDFEKAAKLFAGRDEVRRGWARLGSAFLRAFPKGLPQGAYIVVTTRGGDKVEGFTRETAGGLRIEEATGRSQTYPNAAITGRREIPRDIALQRVADRIRLEGEDQATTGTRLFALVEAACRADRPAAAATLLERLLQKDEQKPFFLSAVRHRVPAESQKELYRVFAQCELAKLERQEPAALLRNGSEDTSGTDGEAIDEAPRDRGDPKPRSRPNRLKLDGSRKGKRRGNKNRVRHPKALARLRDAAPYRKRALKLYRDLVKKGVANASTAEIEAVINPFQKAYDLYEKAVLIEDHDDIYALLRPCSRILFQLRFWKQQRHGR